jgi:hypothetical protein
MIKTVGDLERNMRKHPYRCFKNCEKCPAKTASGKAAHDACVMCRERNTQHIKEVIKL